MPCARLPVYRPLVGFDKREIVEISEKIGTYEVSIQPFEDCCTIFVAKHPVTKPNIERIEKSELNLTEKIDELMQTARGYDGDDYNRTERGRLLKRVCPGKFSAKKEAVWFRQLRGFSIYLIM